MKSVSRGTQEDRARPRALAPHHGSQRFKSERERHTFVFSLVFPTLSEAPSSRTRSFGVVACEVGEILEGTRPESGIAASNSHRSSRMLHEDWRILLPANAEWGSCCSEPVGRGEMDGRTGGFSRETRSLARQNLTLDVAANQSSSKSVFSHVHCVCINDSAVY